MDAWMNPDLWIDIASRICFGLGGFFLLTGAVGIIRMPDFFTRLHPAGVPDGLGAPLVLLGILLQTEWGTVSVKILLLIIFSLITSATACHALAKSALLGGRKPVGKIIPENKSK